jgi:hypothetical protein
MVGSRVISQVLEMMASGPDCKWLEHLLAVLVVMPYFNGKVMRADEVDEPHLKIRWAAGAADSKAGAACILLAADGRVAIPSPAGRAMGRRDIVFSNGVGIKPIDCSFVSVRGRSGRGGFVIVRAWLTTHRAVVRRGNCPGPARGWPAAVDVDVC